MKKYQIGDWVYNQNHGAGIVRSTYVPVIGEAEYTVRFTGEWKSTIIPESRLTKIEHSYRPGHRVRFWTQFGAVSHEGVITAISPDYVDIESYSGKHTRHYASITRIEQPKTDLPFPPNYDTLKVKTVTLNFTTPEGEAFKVISGFDAPPVPKRVKEAREALDKQIKDAEAELAKLRAARRAL